jgi:hypothetical protein
MGINTVGGCDCRCGGDCTDCCGDNGNTPAEYEVDLAFTDDECSLCDAGMSTTYTLDGPASPGCNWTYANLAPGFDLSFGVCKANYTLQSIYINLSVECSTGGSYLARLVVYHSYRDQVDAPSNCTAAPSGRYVNIYTWEATIAADSYNCSTDELELTLVSSDCQCGSYAGFTAECAEIEFGCTAPATVTIVPVP